MAVKEYSFINLFRAMAAFWVLTAQIYNSHFKGIRSIP
jgi:hypothetical protein